MYSSSKFSRCHFHPEIHQRLSLANAAEFVSAVRVDRLGRGRLRSDLWTHSSRRLPQVVHGISEGNLEYRHCLFLIPQPKNISTFMWFLLVCLFPLRTTRSSRGFRLTKASSRVHSVGSLPTASYRVARVGMWKLARGTHRPTRRCVCW